MNTLNSLISEGNKGQGLNPNQHMQQQSSYGNMMNMEYPVYGGNLPPPPPPPPPSFKSQGHPIPMQNSMVASYQYNQPNQQIPIIGGSNLGANNSNMGSSNQQMYQQQQMIGRGMSNVNTGNIVNSGMNMLSASSSVMGGASQNLAGVQNSALSGIGSLMSGVSQMNNVVQVRNIFYQANNEEILEYMECAGTIIDYFIKKEEHRVIGQFTYADDESALCAVQMLDNHKICGSNRELKVKLCTQSMGGEDFTNPNIVSNEENSKFAGERLDAFDRIEQARNLEEAVLSLDEESQQSILGALKQFAEQDEERLTLLLSSKPHLCDVLMQIQRKYNNRNPQINAPSQSIQHYSHTKPFNDDLTLKKIGETQIHSQKNEIKGNYPFSHSHLAPTKPAHQQSYNQPFTQPQPPNVRYGQTGPPPPPIHPSNVQHSHQLYAAPQNQYQPNQNISGNQPPNYLLQNNQMPYSQYHNPPFPQQFSSSNPPNSNMAYPNDRNNQQQHKPNQNIRYSRPNSSNTNPIRVQQQPYQSQ